MKIQTKINHFFYSISIIISFSIFLFIISCSKDDENSPSDGDTPIIKKDVLSKHTSFEIPISETAPPTISTLVSNFFTVPNSPYGTNAIIDFIVNADNSIDVLWVGTNNSKHLSRISLTNQSLIKDLQIPAKANTGYGKFLGFDSLGDNKFIIGYSTKNSFQNENAEAWYTAFDGNTGAELFSTRIFGEADLSIIGSKGEPSSFGSSIVKYNSTNNVIGIYLSHTEKSNDNIRHQAGWLGFLDGTTGNLLTKTSPSSGVTTIVGNKWFYSHNFDQRGIFSNEGKFYVLAHGDAYPRALGFAKFSHTSGIESEFLYHTILSGNNNVTNAHTGDLTELSNGNVALVYSTSDNRNTRDLKLIILKNVKESTGSSPPVVLKELWVNQNKTEEYTGWGSKIIPFGNNILIAWNTFNTNGTPLNTKFCLYDLENNLLSAPETIPKVILYPTQSIKKTPDNKKIVFVSYEGTNKLIIHTIATE